MDEKYVSASKIDEKTAVKSLVSYSVGCMFGRYSLEKEGLIYAGGEWNPTKGDALFPDKDNIIPIVDEEYFEDDIVGLFFDWIQEAYGKECFDENIEY